MKEHVKKIPVPILKLWKQNKAEHIILPLSLGFKKEICDASGVK
jgi:hypothetical protein